VNLKLPLGRFEAYLFDCDGTIVDSMPLHYIAWKEALAEWNCALDEQLFYAQLAPRRRIILKNDVGFRMGNSRDLGSLLNERDGK
jgi:beta-phosphoglucomutase-like phosphatase (HAD superfamily)